MVIFSACLNPVWVIVNDQCTYHSICFLFVFCEVIIMKIRFLISYFHNVMWFSMYDIECGIWWSLLKLGFYRNISKLLGGSYKVFYTHTVPWGLFLAKFLLGQLMQGQVWKLISNCKLWSSDVGWTDFSNGFLILILALFAKLDRIEISGKFLWSNRNSFRQ